jgi:TPP-dependent 2-oxoacid decarboxylase
MTVGKYLVKRLEQLRLEHVFGVPGDYMLTFFEYLEKSKIKLIGNCNELNAGYAADAYARIKGLSAVCVTYDVGGLSLLNAVVGSFAERLPVIVISGGPKITERPHHHLLHHTIGDMDLQYKIYEKVTVAAVILMDPEKAPAQIDETIAACIRLKRPVYIEIPLDIVDMPCRGPERLKIDEAIVSDKDSLKEAIEETAGILKKSRNPIVLAGIEPHRFHIQKELKSLIEHLGYPFAVSLLGKSVLSEKHPQFVGVYGGVASRPEARALAEGADCILCLGTLMTDVELGHERILRDQSKMILANSDKVRVRHHTYDNISLKDFMDGLRKKIPRGKTKLLKMKHPSEEAKKKFVPKSDAAITVKRFYERMNHFIKGDDIIIADTGDCLFSAADLLLPDGARFLDQAFYLSIGYSVPATLGAQLAAPGKRVVTFVGDGAFQMTGQELSTIIWHGLHPVVFLMNNKGYAVERVMNDGSFNDLSDWQYHLLPGIFNGRRGVEVRTEGELEETLKSIDDRPGHFAFIEVCLGKRDYSDHLKQQGELYRKVWKK